MRVNWSLTPSWIEVEAPLVVEIREAMNKHCFLEQFLFLEVLSDLPKILSIWASLFE